MKKNCVLIVCSLIFSFFSCVDETLVRESDTFRIIGGWDNLSRTYFVEKDSSIRTHWEVYDRIGLFTENQSNLAYRAINEGATTEFEWSHGEKLKYEEGKKVRAYYPHHNIMYDENRIRMYGTSYQTSSSEVPMFLYGEGGMTGNELNIKFKHCFTYLKFTISSEDFRNCLNLDDEWLKKIEQDNRETEAIIEINSSAPVDALCYDLETNSFVLSEDKDISFYCKDLDINNDENHTYYIALAPQPAGTCIEVSLKYGKRNYVHASGLLFGKFTPKNGLKAGHVYSVDPAEGVLVDEGQFKALEALYNATGGDNWTYKENWLSDKPLIEWQGVNNNTDNCSYVTRLTLGKNNLKGSLPEEFAVLMDHAERLYLNDNLLTGDIPEAVTNHPNWNKLGWNIVLQDQDDGGGFNLLNSNLYINNMKVTDMLDNSEKELYDLFAQNELTQIIKISGKSGAAVSLTPTRVNQFLDFQTKGLGTIITFESNDDIKEFATDYFSKVEGIEWIGDLSNAPNMKNYHSYVFDKNGQLVYITRFEYWDSDYSNMVLADNTEILKAEYDFFKAYLGNPETSHPEFTYDYLYTSSDYSKDGEVFAIQNATVGKGLDIVLMGNYYVDKDMESDGKYEQRMREATEDIFSIEPYKSLRNRFNVYGVKVVSPNSEIWYGKGGISSHSDAVEYATKVPTECPLIAVIYNTAEISIGRSSCATYEDESCIAWILDGADGTIIHEMCGHGIGHLKDEYVETGNEYLKIPDSKIETMKDLASLFKWGSGMNVDYKNDPNTVRWAHLLADERFQNEDLGIYEGAALYGYGAYRPSDDSVMRYNMLWFNAPSRETIYKTVMSRSEGDEWEYDYEKFVAFDEVARNSSTSSRSAVKKLSDEEIRKIQERHCPPSFINGTWRDALNSNNNSIIVPFR